MERNDDQFAKTGSGQTDGNILKRTQEEGREGVSRTASTRFPAGASGTSTPADPRFILNFPYVCPEPVLANFGLLV
jgi:hypothetical protein